MFDITIKGSCVSREAFNYQKELFDEEIFYVSNYIFQKPIAVIESEKITNIEPDIIDKLKLELINKESVQDFVVNQVNNSFSKNFLKDVSSKEKFFLIDFVDERMNLIQLGDSFIEYRREFLNVLNKENIDFKIVKNTKDITFNIIDKFINNIKKKYPEKNIILHKAFAFNITKINNIMMPLTSTFANPLDRRSINSYSSKRSTNVNLFFLELYNYIEANYPEIKIIELPIKNYYSPCDHKYGRGFYHYDNQYYFDFLQQLKKLLTNKNTKKDEVVAKENKRYIYDLNQMQKVIANIYRTSDTSMFTKNPEELLFRPLNTPIPYKVNNAGKPLIKSYIINDLIPGIMFFGNQGDIKAKFIFNKNNELERIYTFYKNKNIESITYFENDWVTSTSLFDLNKRNITKEGNAETISRQYDKVYSFYNPDKQLVLRIINNQKLKLKTFLFYENNRKTISISLSNNKINRFVKYHLDGSIFEEYIMGEYINIGNVQTKFRYVKKKKKIRYIFYPSGKLQARTLFAENGKYLKTELFDVDGEIRKEITFNNEGLKSQTIDYLAKGKKKISNYFKTGIRQSIATYYNGVMVKEVSRKSEKELFVDSLSLIKK
ncbi:DUF6270 domain-containing protein [Heyndrickxia sporothermodurans]|uniref:DUF6270 domain-containing protein n=1 Tax=Heyndrickxia sporothermodurans TaxID=46224 RepID=UPI003D226668